MAGGFYEFVGGDETGGGVGGTFDFGDDSCFFSSVFEDSLIKFILGAANLFIVKRDLCLAAEPEDGGGGLAIPNPPNGLLFDP